MQHSRGGKSGAVHMNFLAEGDEGDGQGEDWGGARAPVGGGRGARGGSNG